MPMRLTILSTILGLLLIACGESSTPGFSGAAGVGGSFEFTTTLSHTYEPQMLERAEETSDVCQSWVLGNDEPLYVTKVRQTNEGGWHHSNWFFVPEAAYPPNEELEGPNAQLEGTWRCSDRGFREYIAAAAGGVFFAQSTQALDELQAFPDGAALEIPPRSVIVGSTHLLNITAGPLETAMTMEVEAVPSEEVQIRLTPFSFAIGDLAIPPAVDGVPTRSRTSMMCDLREPFQEILGKDEVDYNIYYVLGHYHQWGSAFNLSFVQEDGSMETVFDIKNKIGEPIGSIVDPPMNNNGATRLRSECGFINNTDETLRRGLQYGEMCDFLAYTDANLKIGASGINNRATGVDEEGVAVFETDCGPIIGFPAYPDEL
jgi:hypothetical protein